MSLKNGWVLRDKEWEVGTGWPGGGASPLTYPVGASNTDVTSELSSSVPFGYIRFYVIFLAEGPKGVSHKRASAGASPSASARRTGTSGSRSTKRGGERRAEPRR